MKNSVYRQMSQSKFSKISTSRKVHTFRDGSPMIISTLPNGIQGGWRGTKQQIIRGEMNHVQLNFLLFFTICKCVKNAFSFFRVSRIREKHKFSEYCKSRILPNGEERLLVRICAKSKSRLQNQPGIDDSHLYQCSEF